MKITITLLSVLFPLFIIGQNCEFFPLDTANICGYEYTLPIALEEGTITHTCEDNQYFSISYATEETNLAFSSCGIYNLIYEATDGSCVDTLTIQVSDPNTAITNKSIDITLDYGDIDCPGNITADCYGSAGVSIPLASGPPTPIWSFCSITECQSSLYTSDTLGNINGCVADSIVLETYSTYSSSEYCSDDMQEAFIVLNAEGNTVTDNTLLDYIAQLQDTTNLDCPSLELECSFTNTSTCYDSIVIDTTFLPIPVRIGGQWTMPMIDTLQLYDTTYFTYFSIDYELIIAPGVKHYGPEDLIVNLNEIYISNSNDTTRRYPSDFYLTLQWEEEWIIDTIQIITEQEFDTDGDCFACGGFSYSSGFNVPEIPDFPCGPVSIYYPSICDCEYDEPDYALQSIGCNEWFFEVLSPEHIIQSVSEGNVSIGQSNAMTIYGPSNQYIDIETVDFNGCSYFITIDIDYISTTYLEGVGDLSCETTVINLSTYGLYQFSGLPYYPSNAVWSNGQTGNSISVYDVGDYSVTYIDEQGCPHSITAFIGFDDTIDCNDENPLADTECHMEEFDIICDIMTFDSFNYQMPSQSSDGNQPQALCADGGVPNNISWFSFVAYSGDYSLNIIPSNCYGSADGQEGIQVGLYSDCSFSNSTFCSSECSLDNISVPSQDLIEGQVYHMFIDGCQGSICNYKMEIEGNPEQPNLAPESMTLSAEGDNIQNVNSGVIQEYCLGTDIRSQLTGVEIQGEYHWSIYTLEGTPYLGASSVITTDNDVNLTFDTKGTYQICINEIQNGCDLFTWNGQMCFTIKIDHTEDEDFGTHYVCEGEESNYDTSILDNYDPNEDGKSGLQANQQNYQTGENLIIVYDDSGCAYEQKFELETLTFSNNLAIPTSCSIDGITLDFEAYYNDISFDEDMTIDIIGPNGQFINNDLDQDTYTIPHGSIDGPYTIVFSKTKENVTCDIASELQLSFSEMEPATPQITNGPMALCATEGSVTYIATNSDPNIDFVWSVDGDISSFTISGNHNEYLSIDWKDTGGNLSVSAVNECGLQKSTSNDIIVYNSPSLAMTNDDETCINSECTITLNVDETLIDSYSWDFNGASVTSDNGIDTNTLIWDTPGQKEISLTIIDIYGCDQKIEAEIMVNDRPEFDLTYDESVCFGQESTLLELSISSNQYTTILIDGETSDINANVTPGAHEITVMNSNMCATSQIIFIEEREEINISISGDNNITEGQEHEYSIDQTLNLDLDLNSISWSINGIEYCSGAECLSINPDLDSDSEIAITARTNEGCQIFSAIRVVVEKLSPTLVIPNIFSPNNDGVNDYWFVVPNKDDITIEYIKILDRWNNLVYEKGIKSSGIDMKWDGKMNGSDLQPGVYVYAISYSVDNTTETIYGDVTIIK